MKKYKNWTSDSLINKNHTKILQIGFAIIFVSIFLFLFKLQVLHDESMSEASNKDDNIQHTTSAQRGNIYFTDKSGSLIPVAINKSYKTIAVDPKTLQRDNEVEIAAKLLSPIVNISEEDVNVLSDFDKLKKGEIPLKTPDGEEIQYYPKIISAPPRAMKKQTPFSIKIRPTKEKSKTSDLAKRILDLLIKNVPDSLKKWMRMASLDAIIRAIPPGGGIVIMD